MDSTIKNTKNIELLISRKYLKIDTSKYMVAVLDNLWNLYDGDVEKENFCSSLVFYCDEMNAYYGFDVKKEQPLLISLKDEDNNVTPRIIYHRNKQIQIV